MSRKSHKRAVLTLAVAVFILGIATESLLGIFGALALFLMMLVDPHLASPPDH